MFHIISCISLGIVEKAPDQLIIPNNAKYVIIVGNISDSPKRTMLFAEELAKKYPLVNIIFNYGQDELQGKEYFKIKETFNQKLRSFQLVPKNLYYPKGEIIGSYSFYSTEGWPFISEDKFYNSIFKSSFIIKMDEHLYIGDRLVSKRYPRYFTYEYYEELRTKEQVLLKQWVDKELKVPKVLITSFGVSSHLLLDKNSFEMLAGLDKEKFIWVSTDLYPGRNRSGTISL
jgi:hypothetical protein